MGALTLADLELLAAMFRDGDWQEVRISWGETSILLSHDLAAQGVSSAPGSQPAQEGGVIPTPQPARQTGAPDVDPEWVAVLAPNLGTFYRSPKPGAAPFVQLGDKVAPGTEICLLEVMKLFTSVKAGVAGTVRQICAEDAELVEGGRVLFHIESE